jgi:hypothetical protein
LRFIPAGTPDPLSDNLSMMMIFYGGFLTILTRATGALKKYQLDYESMRKINPR